VLVRVERGEELATARGGGGLSTPMTESELADYAYDWGTILEKYEKMNTKMH
jgi:hypothetical protein